MAEPTLEAVFGAGSAQTATTITISKTDLASVGLTAASDNSAESLLASIFLKAKETLTEDSFGTNFDQSITITPGFNSIVQRDDGTGTFVEYRQFQYNLNAHKLDNSLLDPDEL